MILKDADDKAADLATLQGLLNHPQATSEIRQRIEREMRNIQAGMRGEAETAYEMRVHYGGGQNWVVLHDLRIEFEGLVAQIDHLLINRWLDIWVCESKHFSEGVAINEQGEFTAFFNGRPYGVPSPLAQNDKHLLILRKVFASDLVAFPSRLGITLKPELRGMVLVSKKARIARPKTPVPGLECVIKTDQLAAAVDQLMEGKGALSLARVVGTDTLERLGRQLMELHRPASFDWAGKFGLKDEGGGAAVVEPLTAPVPAPVSLEPQPPEPSVELGEAPTAAVAADDVEVAVSAAPRRKLLCQQCGISISYAVAKFCWVNKTRFGGKTYCMDCQKQIGTGPARVEGQPVDVPESQ